MVHTSGRLLSLLAFTAAATACRRRYVASRCVGPCAKEGRKDYIPEVDSTEEYSS